MTTDLLDRVIVDPAICFGKPTIRGHRLWVSLILGHLAEGWAVDAVLAEFPQLEVDDVRACIAYGANSPMSGSPTSTLPGEVQA